MFRLAKAVFLLAIESLQSLTANSGCRMRTIAVCDGNTSIFDRNIAVKNGNVAVRDRKIEVGNRNERIAIYKKRNYRSSRIRK